MSIRLRLILLAGVSSLSLLLFGAAALYQLQTLKKQLMGFFTLGEARPANTLTTLREATYGNA